MKRILILIIALMPSAAFAEDPSQYTLSASLVAEIFREMNMARLQADAQAATIAKLQAEVQHQQAPASPALPGPVKH